MSALSIQRPDSRASTTSATSQNDDAHTHDAKAVQNVHMHNGAEEALMHWQNSLAPQAGVQYDLAHHHQQHLGHHQHPQGATYPMQAQYGDSAYMPQDVGYGHHVRVGSVPIPSGADVPDDKRRKGSAVTATNDKELREMLAKNEGRPLRDVAQEVIQKERTPMAEKTKQLFAMLW